MRFRIKKYDLLGLFDRAFGVAGRSVALQVLQHVRVEVDESSLTVTGSDGELTLQARTTKFKPEVSGVAVFPPRVHAIVKVAPDEDLLLEVVKGSVTIYYGKSFSEVKLEYAEYPALDITHKPIQSLPKEKLLLALDACRPAVMAENVRPNYAFVQVAGDVLRATDGSRVHQVSIPLGFEALWPARAVLELAKRLRSTASDTIEYGRTENTFTFRCDEDLLVATRHVTGYPDVKKFMIDLAEQNDLRIELDRKELLDAVTRAAVSADPDTKFMSLSFDNNVLTLTTSDKFGNNAKEHLVVDWPFEPMSLATNHDHLEAMLAALSASTVVVTMKSKTSAGGAPIGFIEGKSGFFGILVQLRPELTDAARSRVAQGVQASFAALRGNTVSAIKEERQRAMATVGARGPEPIRELDDSGFVLSSDDED